MSGLVFWRDSANTCRGYFSPSDEPPVFSPCSRDPCAIRRPRYALETTKTAEFSFRRAAWVVEACGVADIGRAAATLTNGADSLRGAVRAAVGENQRLLEAEDVDGAPAGKG